MDGLLNRASVQHVTSNNRRGFRYSYLFRYPLTPIQSASMLFLRTSA